MKYDLNLFLVGIILGTTTAILTLFATMENASAFHTEAEMKAYQKINEKKHDAEIEAILNGNFPGQGEVFEEYPPFVSEVAICDENWHCDLKVEHKRKLASIIKHYPQTQAFIKKNEGWRQDRYPELGKKRNYAIGFGDNMFLVKNPQVKKISKDLGNFLMIEHITADQPKVKSVLKNQPEAWCPAIRTVISDLIYQYGGTGFEKTEQTRNVYRLSVDGFIKNWDEIKVYLKRNPYKLRNQGRIELIEQDECFKKALAKYKAKKQPKRKQSISQILEEIGA